MGLAIVDDQVRGGQTRLYFDQKGIWYPIKKVEVEFCVFIHCRVSVRAFDHTLLVTFTYWGALEIFRA